MKVDSKVSTASNIGTAGATAAAATGAISAATIYSKSMGNSTSDRRAPDHAASKARNSSRKR